MRTLAELLELAEAARRDPSLLPNHRGIVDRRIRKEILEREVLLNLQNNGTWWPGGEGESAEFRARIESELEALRLALRAYTHPTPLELGVKGWSSRYLEYCSANGHEGDPEGMLAEDRERWPGGVNVGFLIWANRRTRKAS